MTAAISPDIVRSSMVNDRNSVKKTRQCIGIRYLQTFLFFLALTLSFVTRVNMSVAVVGMATQDADLFDWSPQTRSTVLSSFMWGYPILCIPAGVIASHFGGKVSVALSIFLNCVACFLTPVFAYWVNWQGICVLRFIQGLSQGIIIPSLHAMIGKWAPVAEKSRISALVYAGGQFGSGFALTLSGVLADSIWGWTSIFYGSGILLLVFLVVWLWLASNRPRDARLISLEEIEFIESSIGVSTSPKIRSTPVWTMLKSMPFWAIVAAHATQNWGFWTLQTGVPLYTSKVLGVNLSANGILTAIPFFVMVVLCFPFARLVDLIIERKWLSITTARKLSNTEGHWLPAVALVAFAYTDNTVYTAVAYLILAVGLNVGHFSGFLVVHLDMAPNYAGTLMGFTNCFANVIALIAPIAIGFLVPDDTSVTEWRRVFLLAAGVYFLGNLIFIIFATSERQEWDKNLDSSQDNNENVTNAKEQDKDNTIGGKHGFPETISKI